ncbi:peptidase C14 [Longimonas halophila]|uniref:Peptidase C14 n=1 Tax=Longimonas halophila TaxID=1469170 RepID=A0A2H3P212_9BACT|nr:caspase family protein [Longimonas halophila]PEN05040.1 peptidase C14 [Longimonas halophila]
MKKGLALIIGNSEYQSSGNRLDNPENDANDFAKVLIRLGYKVNVQTNLDLKTLDFHISSFQKELDNYDIGIFYFAGHGMQIEGENFITAVDTNFDSEVDAKYSSFTLNKVLDYMERAKNDSNIIILDACRDNPFEKSWSRSVTQQGLAPMYAPKGTLIAYATSPGEKAADGNSRNGLYTKALLEHIEEENISIEEFFKRVRNSVYAFSNGKQTSWEHTSLTGSFKFNTGQLIHAIGTPYSTEAILDKDFNIHEDDSITKIIKDLKSHNWNIQNPAIHRISSINPSKVNDDKLFVLGRNILQAAEGNAFVAVEFMNNLEQNISRFNENKENHVLNGILFEVYFNSEGDFRKSNIKNGFLNKIYTLSQIDDYQKSFEFIQDHLKPFEQELFFIPGEKQSINLNVVLKENKTTDVDDKYDVSDIKYEGNSVLRYNHDSPFFTSNDDIYFESLLFSRLKSRIAYLTSAPLDLLKITTNYDLEENSKIGFPFDASITRN